MTDEERQERITKALAELAAVRDYLTKYQDDVPGWAFHTARGHLDTAVRHIEAAAMPRPSVLRRWFRKEAA